MGKRTLKKPSKGFKRSRKEWAETIATHLGKFVDRLTPDDALLMGLGAWGALHTQTLHGGLATMLGYKLATTGGGTPPLAQVSGLILLSGVGAAPYVVPGLGMFAEQMQEFLEEVSKDPKRASEHLWKPPGFDELPEPREGYVWKWSIFGGWQEVLEKMIPPV